MNYPSKGVLSTPIIFSGSQAVPTKHIYTFTDTAGKEYKFSMERAIDPKEHYGLYNVKGKKTIHQIQIVPPAATPPSNWHSRVISEIDQFHDDKISNIPHLFDYLDVSEKFASVQSMIDEIGNFMDRFNEWLANNSFDKEKGEHVDFKEMLLVFVLKLPVRVARNITYMIYQIIKTITNAVFHPAESVIKLAKLIVDLIYALTQPETWTKIGAGMVGAAVGQALILGNPISILLVAIGSAMMLGGLTAGTVRAAIQAEKESRAQVVKEYLGKEIAQLPEALLTGFCLGLLIGGIQHAVQARQISEFRATTKAEASDWANRYSKYYDIPEYDSISWKERQITMTWSEENMNQIANKVPAYRSGPHTFQISLMPNAAHYRVPFFAGFPFTNNIAVIPGAVSSQN